jgi:hypothetical protein
MRLNRNLETKIKVILSATGHNPVHTVDRVGHAKGSLEQLADLTCICQVGFESLCMGARRRNRLHNVGQEEARGLASFLD